MVEESRTFEEAASSQTSRRPFEEELLHAARNGDVSRVQEILTIARQGEEVVDINCKGKSKSNLGWTPLHLASYFGHREVVQLLLDHDVDINAVNDVGDTALHKAAFIGREDLVILLLGRNADVNIRNGEGRTARDVGVEDGDTKRLLEAAEKTDSRRKEEALLSAARNGDLVQISNLLKSERPPNINCVDSLGNTALHCASYRGHKEAAVSLLQNGIDSTIGNIRGQTALMLARDAHMSQVLCVRPVRQVQRTVTRFESMLLKRSRFLGWKPTWAVLERGVLTYFRSRADASSGVKRRDFKYLDGAVATASDLTSSTFNVDFSDGTTHKLSVSISAEDPSGEIGRQKWLSALAEHIAFNTHYITQGKAVDDSDDEDDDIKPLGSMQDSLQTATAKYQLLETRLQEIGTLMETSSIDSGCVQNSSLKRFEELYDTASSMLSSLAHCLILIKQQEEVRVLQLKQEQEKCRVLEEALNVLAKEHHELEQSMASHMSPTPPLSRSISNASLYRRNPRFYDTSDDEFYDAFEAGGDVSESETLVTAGGSDSDTLVCVPSPTSSITTLASMHSFSSALSCVTSKHLHNNRQCLPVPMFSRNDFSIWSVLKNSIGKELSKITMPVVFNEPLSFLQRMVEYMEYAHLIKEASSKEDPVERLQYICAFAVSALASNWDRLGKPFNPLLGETYELERTEYRVICEQVSHHPPISAFHADSEDFIFHGSIHPKLKFWGKSVEIQPKGTVTVELPKWGEAYTWTNVNCCVHNIIVGKLWIEQYGTLEIVNSVTGHKAVLTFKPAGWFSKDLHRVEGFIMDKNKKKLHFLYGKWTDFLRVTDFVSYEGYFKENAHKFSDQMLWLRIDRSANDSKGPSSNSDSPSQTPKKVLAKLNSLKVGPFKSQTSISEPDDSGPVEPGGSDIPKCDSTYSIDIPNSTTLWEATPRPANAAEYYQFTLFAMSLNEMEPGMEKKICPTDCRLRPDIKKLENGDLDGAAAEKTRLEEQQRDARKARKGKKGSGEWKPRWFCQGTNPHTGQEDWLYTGGYWDRNYGPDPQIF